MEPRANIPAGTKITEAESRGLDQLAETYGMSRAGLLRELVNEAVKAHQQGRALFEVPAAPLTGEQVLLLVQHTQALCLELDRQHDEAARREQRLNNAYRENEAAGSAKLQKLADEIRTQMADGATPFRTSLDCLREELQNYPHVLSQKISPCLVSIGEQLATIQNAAEQPRTNNNFVIPGGQAFAVKMLLGWLSLAAAAGLFLGLIAPSLSRPTAVFAARRALNTPDRICQFLDSKYGNDECIVADEERNLGLKILKHEGAL